MNDQEFNDQLTIVDENGVEKECKILFTIHSDEFNKDYVLFYDPSTISDDDDSNVEIMAGSYVYKNGGVGEISQVETDEEWDFLQSAVEEYEKSLYEDQ